MTIPRLGVAYFGNRFVEHARADLDRLTSCSDYVVHTVSETDLAYHKSVLSKIFNESRKRGLEVWADPWGLGGVFGGESFSKFLLDHRNTWQVMSDGRVLPSVCLNRPEWRSFVLEWILTVRDMGAQVLFWDEPHMSMDLESEWEGVYSCVCEACSHLFRKKFGGGMPSRLNDDVRQFRRESIRSFLSEVMVFAKSKGLKNALCLYAFKGHSEYDLIWKELAAIPSLDIFGCDPYWRWHFRKEVASHTREFSKSVVESAKLNGKDSQIWIQAMRLPAQTEQEIETACEVAREEGVNYLAAWSFDGGEILDTVLSERPPQVWESVEKAFRKIRDGK